ncbi:hypothetical protein [Shewanella surugensis]|uniref:Uncharacterized protein n=1 Tax=Shewanella surugensis TaxID=212020 RepID=A0ABT0LF64_9GAMM|nr:hypothetical protein [Shewanella surugensis]MCL1125967.1 hypothetical protein [Shewanella surugensis]
MHILKLSEISQVSGGMQSLTHYALLGAGIGLLCVGSAIASPITAAVAVYFGMTGPATVTGTIATSVVTGVVVAIGKDLYDDYRDEIWAFCTFS